MKYRKKPVVIEAITFDELVAHGIASGASCPGTPGMPWSFDYKGQHITHENDDCYLIPTLEGSMRFNRGDFLLTGVKGEIYPCKPDIFAATYEPEFGIRQRFFDEARRVAEEGPKASLYSLLALYAEMKSEESK